MTLAQKIDEDLKTALKARETLKLSCLRMLKAAASNKAIEKGKSILEDAEIIDVIAKLIKQREESVAAFTKGNRPELAQKENQEAQILQAYLPPALSDEDLKAVIQAALQEIGARGPQAMGAVMKAVGPKTAGRADGKRVSDMVRQLLAGSTQP